MSTAHHWKSEFILHHLVLLLPLTVSWQRLNEEMARKIRIRKLMNIEKTRPDTRHKMRRGCVLFTYENNTGQTDGPTDGRTRPVIEMRRRI